MRVALDRASEALQAAIALISRQIGIASLNMAGSTRSGTSLKGRRIR
jgi:hypothetical protein